jgi:hypothetical protein
MNRNTMLLLLAGAVFGGLVYLGRKSTVKADGTQSSALSDFLGSVGGGGASSYTMPEPTVEERAQQMDWNGVNAKRHYYANNTVENRVLGADGNNFQLAKQDGWKLTGLFDWNGDGKLDAMWSKAGIFSIWQGKN